MEWNEAQVRQLGGLWTAGLSTAAIGRILGTSKNSVVGKAHRLDLPARPSPIRASNGTPHVPAVPKVYNRRTLPALASLVEAAVPSVLCHVDGGVALTGASRPPPAPPQKAPEPKVRRSRWEHCQWVTNSSRPWEFCQAPCEGESPYCSEHAKRVRGSVSSHSLGVEKRR